ncbi:hypothetical protein [Streptomyces sp. CHB9.2]|uniref:hypothetical protein n=1 Tax=Streptomyces sp. CHB9.2 TaxID=2841670 RepID=UPI0020963CF8|nr:hypothetical protein [Streptomyces sp. CHB9.2]MCO6704776.1 hypothetical protein [Streptomyces sp. CHB9.2]
MAMSDCIKCWETPCACGHDYKDWTEARLEAQIAMLQKVLDEKRKPKPEPQDDVIDVQSHPNEKFVGEFQAMVMSRTNRKTVGLYPATVVYGGYLRDDKIEEVPLHQPATSLLLIGSRKYRIKLSDSLYHGMTANVGQCYAIIKHHTQHYIVPTVTAGGHSDVQFMSSPKEGN